MLRDMRFPTMWYVRPAKPQISLHIRAAQARLSLRLSKCHMVGDHMSAQIIKKQTKKKHSTLPSMQRVSSFSETNYAICVSKWTIGIN